MTRCEAFYRKFDRDGNFCGLDEKTVYQVKAYIAEKKKINEIAAKSAIADISISEGACRALVTKQNAKIHDQILAKIVILVASKVAAGEEPVITGIEVQSIIDALRPPKVQPAVEEPTVQPEESAVTQPEEPMQVCEETDKVQDCEEPRCFAYLVDTIVAKGFDIQKALSAFTSAVAEKSGITPERIKANRAAYIQEQVRANAGKTWPKKLPHQYVICNECEAVYENDVPSDSNFCKACDGRDLRVVGEEGIKLTGESLILNAVRDAHDGKSSEHPLITGSPMPSSRDLVNALVADIRIGLASGLNLAKIKQVFTELAEGSLEDEVAGKIPDVAAIKAAREQFIQEHIDNPSEGGSCSTTTVLVCEDCGATYENDVPCDGNFCKACGGQNLRHLREDEDNKIAWYRINMSERK